jgi:hypothetical protein
MFSVFILNFQTTMLNNVQITEPENHHHYTEEVNNKMVALDEQIILCEPEECTTDQHMDASQSMNNDDELLELYE